MARVVLVQPRKGARISGGYLYNARLAEHGAFELCELDPAALASELPSVQADLLLADSIWLTEPDFAPFLAASARGQRVGVVMHSFPSMIRAAESGEAPLRAPTAFELDALRRVGLAVTPGPHYADMLAGEPVRVLICEPGISDALRHPPRDRSGPCQLISLGAVTPRKGCLDVLEALKPRARDPGYHFTIVGSLEADPDYARACAALAGASPSVTLAGQLEPHEVHARLARADVLVMPSYDENHPLVLLEAMAASVPAVAYAAGAARQMVEHGREGLIAAIGDRTALAAHLALMIDDERARRDMAEACWQRQARLPAWPLAGRMAAAQLRAEIASAI